MPPYPSAPIIVGVGEVSNRSLATDDALEPATLIEGAVRNALEDTGASSKTLQNSIDSISIIPPWTWAYHDLPGRIADSLGSAAPHRQLAPHGGNQPAKLCDEAARRIAHGESKLCVIAGGEALASLAACRKAGIDSPPGWPEQPDTGRFSLDDALLNKKDIGSKHAFGLPVHVYPLYENALRAKRKQTYEENNLESAEMYAAFDAIACESGHSWRANQKPRRAEDIGKTSGKNRMICTPYPLLMNAFNTVNLAAACVVTSVGFAQELGIPEEKWVYVRGGAGTSEREQFWERPSFDSSEAISRSIDSTLDVSRLGERDIDCFDFYSCFPIVPKLACRHVGLHPVRPSVPITVLGGLTSFGGAGNNYSMHAIAKMSRQIRERRVTNGLVLANGGVLTYQHAVCLSSSSNSIPYPAKRPLPEHVGGLPESSFAERPQGLAVIETYTVEHDRQGNPKLGLIVGRLKDNGTRFVANHGNDAALRVLVDKAYEPIGVQGLVRQADDGRNVFSVGSGSKL